MNLCLEFLNDSERQPIELRRSILLIGRHPECDVRIKLSSISRRHCCIAQVDQAMIIRDLGSRHGVWVNGTRVDEKTLQPGDQLAIGPIMFKVASSKVSDAPPSGSVTPSVELHESEQDLAQKPVFIDNEISEPSPFTDNQAAKKPDPQFRIQETFSNPEHRIHEDLQGHNQVHSDLHAESPKSDPDPSAEPSKMDSGFELEL